MKYGMSVTVENYGKIADRASALGLLNPDGFVILPRNFDSATDISELFYEDSTVTLRKLFRAGGVAESPLEKAETIPRIQENASELILPTILVTASLISENSALVSIALNIISSYAVDFLKGFPKDRTVKLNIVVERDRDHESKKLQYEGPPEGIPTLGPAIRKMFDES